MGHICKKLKIKDQLFVTQTYQQLSKWWRAQNRHFQMAPVMAHKILDLKVKRGFDDTVVWIYKCN